MLELNDVERETLKAIHRLAPDGGQVRTGDLAGQLGVTPGSVVARVRRLAQRGLVAHEPYRGVTLTTAGEAGAAAAIRRHRIIERFLADMLGYSWQDADRLATAFEHALPDEVEERLDDALHRPATCPHGMPIPARSADAIPPLPTLSSLEPGESAVVALPGSLAPDVVEFLCAMGLRPGARVRITDKQPFDGPVMVVVDGADQTVGNRLAQHIRVQRVAS